jgi:hypothetical protein
VKDHFADYLASRREQGRPVPKFIVREFQAFLGCGDIRRGSATLACNGCGFRRLIPFSCKKRSWCPYCLIRRLWDHAEFLRDQIFGDTPVRHWVQTLPPPLRYLPAFDPSLVTAILGVHRDQIFRYLKRKAKSVLKLKSVNQAHPGAVTVIQRFSSDLSLNLHFHTLATDGVFVQLVPDGPVTFHELPAPTDQEVADVAWATCRRVRDLLVRRGEWQDTPDEAVAEPSSRPTVSGVLSLGPGKPRPVRFCATAARREHDEPVKRDGAYAFDLWARQSVGRGDRKKLDKLLRYILNPPFTDKQLRRGPEGQVLFDLKRPRLDGTQTRAFTTDEFLDCLVLLTTRPHANLIRFHGVYAPNHHLRDKVVPGCSKAETPPRPDSKESTDDYQAWGELLSRAHRQDVMRCPRCSRRMQLIALRSDRRNYRRETGPQPDVPPPEPEAA